MKQDFKIKRVVGKSMARGNGGNSRIPQKSKRQPNREARRAISDNIFGPHRPLSPESTQTLKHVLNELQQDGHIPEHVQVRSFFRLTLFEKRKMRRSLERGIVGGYALYPAINTIEQKTADSRNNPLVVTLGKACLMNRRDQAIVVRVEDDVRLTHEHEAVIDTLGAMGLRGLEQGRTFKPHLQLGEARHSLSVTEKLHVTHVLEDVLSGQPITLLPFSLGESRRP